MQAEKHWTLTGSYVSGWLERIDSYGSSAQYISVENYVTTDVGDQATDRYTDASGVVWQRYFFDDGISAMLPGDCFVLSPDGERVALGDQVKVSWQGMTTAWFDCFDDNAHIATIGISRQQMTGFQMHDAVGLYSFDVGMIRFDDTIFTLYHLFLPADKDIAFYFSHPSRRFGVLESLLLPEALVLEEKDSPSSVYQHDVYYLEPEQFVIREGRKVDGYHSWTISLLSGYLDVTGTVIEDGAFVFAMDTIRASVFDNGWLKTILEDDLKSDNFFAVERYPTASYHVSSGSFLSGAMWVDGVFDLKWISKDLLLTLDSVSFSWDNLLTTWRFFFNRMVWGVDGMKGIVDDFVGVSFDLKRSK